MTDFMTVTVQPTRPEQQRSTGVRFYSTCCLCRASSKAPVRFPLFLLCFLSLYTCQSAVAATGTVKQCIWGIWADIKNSDAELYSPWGKNASLSSKQREDCKIKYLRCFMLELLMVMDEEVVMGDYAGCINDFNVNLPADTSVGCPPCEVSPRTNITTFLTDLVNLLDQLRTSNVLSLM